MKNNKKRLLHARQIKAKLILAGITHKQIAESLGVQRPSVSEVVGGLKTSKRIRAAVARALGTTPEALWPEDNTKAA